MSRWQKWTASEESALAELGKASLSTQQWDNIGKRLGRSGSSCEHKWRRMRPQESSDLEPDDAAEPSATYEGGGQFTFVYVSDTHGELIDKGCRAAVLDFIAANKPDEVYHGGDVFDLKPLRNGANAEDRAHSIFGDVEQGLEFIKELKPDRITWGNHDHRLWELASSLKEGVEQDAARMLKQKIEQVTGDIICTEYEKRTGWQEIAPGRLIGHGVVSSMYPAKVNCVHFGSTITGHVHAFDYHRLDNLRGDESYVSGCMCEIDQGYNRTHRRTLKHEHGFYFGIADRDTGDWQLWPVRKDSRGRWLDPTRAS